MSLRRILLSAPILSLASIAHAAAAAAPANAHAAATATPDLPERLVDLLLERVGVSTTGGNTATHWSIFAGVLVVAWFTRKFVTTAVFAVLKRLAAQTETTLDDKLFPALEDPFKSMVFVIGSYAALKVLRMPAPLSHLVDVAYKIAFPVVIFWGILRTIDAVIEHLGELAKKKGMGIAAFLPLIKKTVIVLSVVVGALTVIQGFGYDVKTFLTGLGIGGLAFALAAQDTLANLFGSLVVAVDQPFRVGDFVQIGSHTGTIEDIGMRSTKVRTAARTLIALPNRMVANEAIVNFSRMPQRRIDETVGLTYDTTPEQMERFLPDLRKLLRDDPDLHTESIWVCFAGYGDSSLNVEIIYFTASPSWEKHLEIKERINLKIMRLVADHKLAFAFPTRTLQLDAGSINALRPPAARA
ncbi:Low conductance mechanosensitive channel YnaI [mine drainage metagenome]|uniref:Low conductance mechanosensitive channel YnaI n=1 Tax=mine drainage metagenome TaxID=410659 RepID=A0A1J5SY23_9ZZZZ